MNLLENIIENRKFSLSLLRGNIVKDFAVFISIFVAIVVVVSFSC